MNAAIQKVIDEPENKRKAFTSWINSCWWISSEKQIPISMMNSSIGVRSSSIQRLRPNEKLKYGVLGAISAKS
jgi:hypothetical protein